MLRVEKQPLEQQQEQILDQHLNKLLPDQKPDQSMLDHKPQIYNNELDPIVIGSSDSDPESEPCVQSSTTSRAANRAASRATEQGSATDHGKTKGGQANGQSEATGHNKNTPAGKVNPKRKRRAKPGNRLSLSPIPPSKIGAPRQTRNSRAAEQ